jgi:23S rRNA pseudouridine1911/1915/1917 synthase
MTVHRFVVPAGGDDRLDRYLAAAHPDWSRSHCRTLIADGHVQVNEGPCKPSTTVSEGDRVTVDEPPPQPSEVAPQQIPLSILYEDEHLLAVNKPAGLVIHPAAGNPDGTLVNALLHHCNDLSGIGGVERPGIVHRLDKDTTGVLLVAKSNSAHQRLSRAFRWREVRKTYLGVCYGTPEPAEGVVDAPIGRHARDRQRMAVRDDGRASRTLYTVREALAGTALVSFELVTGRTHQIRVHMSHIGHALVGDPVYSGRQWRSLPDAEAQLACRTFPRQALHAWKVCITHPISGEQLDVEAPIPEDLAALIDTLRSIAGR